jgi:hypothetical protein
MEVTERNPVFSVTSVWASVSSVAKTPAHVPAKKRAVVRRPCTANQCAALGLHYLQTSCTLLDRALAARRFGGAFFSSSHPAASCFFSHRENGVEVNLNVYRSA